MTTKQQRLKEVYDCVRANCGIHTQSDFAEAIRITRPALSSAMNGNESYLTKSLFQKICAAFPGVFNLDYLLTGEGTLIAEQVIHDDGVIKVTESIDPSSLVNAALAAKDETIAALREQITTLNELISGLRNEITILKSQSERVGYPFGIGVADEPQKQIKKM